jgi:plastocyanin
MTMLRTSLVAVLALLALGARAEAQAGTTTVAGRLAILDRGDNSGQDVGQAVVWLEGRAPGRLTPVLLETFTEGKQFLPHISVLTVGSSMAFPNHDPFNHNVFSLTPEGRFDLGLYGRGEAKSTQFNQPAIIRVYCNVHAQMSAFIVVRDNSWYAQPGGDGSFRIANVPPGTYTLHVWHERGGQTTRQIDVPATGVRDLALQLDARGFHFTAHLNKYGQPYTRQGRRY